MFIAIIIAIVATEAVIKQVAEQNFSENEKKPVAGGRLYLTRYHNFGAFLNIGQKHPAFLKGISAGLCAACTAVYLLTLGKKGKTLLKTGLSLLLGGAYSNTYDRLLRGYVIDYCGFLTKNKTLGNIVFNISDFCIMIGAAVSVLGN